MSTVLIIPSPPSHSTMMKFSSLTHAPKPLSPSSPSSPSSSSHKTPLRISSVANIFINMRHAREQAKTFDIESCSGDPQTHPCIGTNTESLKKIAIEQVDVFTCIGGVNQATLLRITRATLLGIAELLGGNALVDEQWTCSICGPKNRPNPTFRVQIRYTANAIRSQIPDAHKPVALDQAKGIPGLMTVLSRSE